MELIIGSNKIRNSTECLLFLAKSKFRSKSENVMANFYLRWIYTIKSDST